MSLNKWEKKVLKAPGAERRVPEIERELSEASERDALELAELANFLYPRAEKLRHGTKIGRLCIVALEAQERINALEEALNAALSVVDNCCQCIYQDSDGVWRNRRSDEPVEAVNRALDSGAMKGDEANDA